jgi:hypothetical protein
MQYSYIHAVYMHYSYKQGPYTGCLQDQA